MDKLEMAKQLLADKSKTNPGQTTTAYGTATADSADGLVLVDLGGDTVSPDDEQSIECETTFKVYAGDDVIVSLIGADGAGKTPIVIGVVGRGDQMQGQLDGVINYFWSDEYGVHVSTEEKSVNGPNVLLDADSLDIRKGNSDSESDQEVYASFGREVTVGSRDSSGAVGNYSQVFGTACIASGDYSHAEGNYSEATGAFSHAEGSRSKAIGGYSHAEGNKTEAQGDGSHAEGFNNKAIGNVSHAEGSANEARSSSAHVEGSSNKAIGSCSHAEGNGTEAQGNDSHAEGFSSKAIGSEAHAEGSTTEARATASHAEGMGSKAIGMYAHAEGYYSEAQGNGSHAEGNHTTATEEYQHVQGKFNRQSTHIDIIGNGTSENNRSNAYNLDLNGNAEFQSEVYLGGCTPNGETPYPAVRYNTAEQQNQYYDGSAWQNLGGGIVASGEIAAGQSVTFTPAAGGIYILYTKEYNSSTKAYRGHRAILIAAPEESLFGTVACAQVNMAASTNSGSARAFPTDSTVTITANSSYDVRYAIVRIM